MNDLAARMAALKANMGQKTAPTAPIPAPTPAPPEQKLSGRLMLTIPATAERDEPKDEPTRTPGEADDDLQAKLVAEAKAEPMPKVAAAPTDEVASPRELMEEDRAFEARMSGINIDMPLDEYKEKFNAATKRDRLTEIANLLLVKGPFKPTIEMSNDELQDHIQLCQLFITEFRIMKQANVISFNERQKDLTDAERERLRKRDRAYKPRPSVAKEPGAPKARAAAKTKEEKAIERLMKDMNWSYEKAAKFVKMGE